MKHLTFAVLSPLLAVLLSACATAETQPQSCAADAQIEQSASYSKAMARDARSNLRKLSILAGGSSLPQETSALKLISPKLQSRAVSVLREIDTDLKTGRAFKRLKQLSERCEAPQLTGRAIDYMLQMETLPPDLAHFVKTTGVYKNWLNSTADALRGADVELDIPLPRMEDF